jgi:hypothetical protein
MRRRVSGAMWRGMLVVAVAVVLATSVEAESHPRCFGAASRDPEHPCQNSRLRFSVVPTPREAQIMPSSPCTPVPNSASPAVCEFGVPESMAAQTVALIGDSHSVHWRAALEVVARAKRWRGLSFNMSRCPLSLATPQNESLRSGCMQWRQDVLSWLAVHPKVSTIVVSERSGGPVLAQSGQSQYDAKVAGYIEAWEVLPVSVSHVIVIRDVPYSKRGTLACVTRAMRRHKPAGSACKLPRDTSLHPDPAVDAVTTLRSPRVQAVDLTRFMCGEQWCFPVVGGALVRRDDGGHLTRTFAESLGPYLLRKLDRLIAGWKAPG